MKRLSKRIFIIAEAGVNHNGDLGLAKKMIDAAKISGADAVKFQAFRSEELLTKNASLAPYQKKNSSSTSQFSLLKRLEFSQKEFKSLFDYAKKKKITFFATPFDSLSAKFLHGLGVKLFKISSGDLNNIPFLIEVAKYGKPIVLSTGMSSLSEVKEAARAIVKTGNRKLILLHCTSNYPARFEDLNLKAMHTLKQATGFAVGYSDHSPGIEAAIAAAAMGACVIEKHFTLNKKFKGPDHRASLDTRQLIEMVKAVRNIEKSLGTGEKSPRPSETGVKRVARKSIVAKADIPKGASIVEGMLSFKRPGTGIAPKFYGQVIGKKAKKNIPKDKIISWSVLR
ncbi:MAG: N-acetylneuraminate synthase [Candidatus Omnitrophica bacterium]|nr:N-acetylneuraminate synthase [Candidatus Omnitrophota bacterium]